MTEHLVASLESRMNDYARAGISRRVLEDQALAEADALCRAALPELSAAGLGREPCEEAYVLAWFHFARYTAIEDKDALDVFALSLFLFSANDSADEELPASVRPLLGAASDPGAQAELAHSLHAFGEASADWCALTVAIDLLSRAQASLPGGPDRGGQLADLGAVHAARFALLGDPVDLQAAIDSAEVALAIIPRDHLLWALPVMNLASAFLTRFELTGDPVDLDTAIERGESAVAALPADIEVRVLPLGTLGSAYRARFDRTRELADIDACVDRYEQAVALSPAEDLERAIRLSNLSGAYLVRYEHTGSLDDLNSSVERAEDGVAHSRDPGQRARCLADLTSAYARIYRHSRAVADLRVLIESGQRALAVRPADAVLLSALAIAHEKWFEHHGDPADIDTAIEYAERAVAVGTNPSDHATYLSNLGLARQTRYRAQGDVADLDAAVEYGTAAVAVTPAGDPQLPGLLSNVATSLLRRYERVGVLADVQLAIDHLERAVAASPSDDHVWHLANLGAAYRTRYDHLGDLKDLRAGFDLAERALAATPDDDPALALRLSGLANSYQLRYDHLGKLSDLRQAAEYDERALAATPVGHPDRSKYLSNLCVAFRRLFESGWDQRPADLTKAVEYGEQAVAVVSTDLHQLGLTLTNLGTAYAARFRHSAEPADLAAAVDRCERALEATPPGHPDRANCLNNLAIVYTLDDSTGLDQHARAERLAAHATGLMAAPPMAQVYVAREVGGALSRMGATGAAARSFRTAVQALQSVAPRELSRADQEHRLGSHAGLVSEAVATHLDAGDPCGAVEVAELGRGVLLAAALDTRTDLTELSSVAPELVAEFRSLRDARVAGDQAEQWDRLLGRIRAVPGFERFLHAPQAADLQRIAAGGTVVVLNVAPSRSDAILVREDGITALPLPGVTPEGVAAQTRLLLDATRTSSISGSLARQRVVPQVLSWLWDQVAAPVLEALGCVETPIGQWPRVWWVLIGETSLLPLHAAGLPDGPAVLDRVISSYVPTFRVLQHSRRKRADAAHAQLTVAVRETAGQPALPGTVAEALALHARHSGVKPLTDDTATTTNVLAALQRSTWAHFACHATSNPAEPSSSGLHLHDGVLDVPRISRLRLDDAELVYLSACSTAEVRGRTADEAIHIGSAFQLAGFRHIIATLWPIDDATAADAAHRFYGRLQSADLAPRALHSLARDLRAEHPGDPGRWAPFIHSGP
ncbi:CHAT domain-containing protein [Lentzea terrae]|uniref:CHAT domain-containing protein n=1 Tax=Lentzea terrae TaxID=2200761 RepID=UPI000DD3E672|nr:CHAT domain-containing protein [Lentzea terrae]